MQLNLTHNYDGNVRNLDENSNTLDVTENQALILVKPYGWPEVN